MTNVILSNAIRLIIAGCITYATKVLIPAIKPWLKQQGYYNLVKIVCQGVEKMASTGQITKDKKKATAIKTLEAMGITVDSTIEVMIEAAVEELDLQQGKITEAIVSE